jgi:D-sedoheptulose 7-phosphate isomerase
VSFSKEFLTTTSQILAAIDETQIEQLAQGLRALRESGGRLFVIGVGGGAGHASHATCDLRKIAHMEAYCPLDNVSEITARTNDDGWTESLTGSLEISKLGPDDGVLVFSVGGGDEERQISPNLVAALRLARTRSSKIYGIVGRDGGFTATVADACVVIPPLDPEGVTAQTEAIQAVVWHLLVSHPALKEGEMKWESQS